MWNRCKIVSLSTFKKVGHWIAHILNFFYFGHIALFQVVFFCYVSVFYENINYRYLSSIEKFNLKDQFDLINGKAFQS